MIVTSVRLMLSVLLASIALGGPPTTAPAPPTTQPADRQVEELLTELRSPRFAARESAQKKLAEMGDTALPALIPHISDDDAEVAARIRELVTKPRDPRLRVEIAARFIETADPDWMERGVHMLFEDPSAVSDLFTRRAQAAEGIRLALLTPVAEQLARTKARHDSFRAKYPKWSRENPEAAARLLTMDKASDMYDAEAAYWTAYDVLGDWEEESGTGSREKAPREIAPSDREKSRPRREHPTSAPGQRHP